MIDSVEHRRERRGVALFAALWLVVAIGVVALQFSLEARERRLAAANTVEFAEARAAANAGVEHAFARLDRALAQQALRGLGAASLRAADPWLDADTLYAIGLDTTDARYQVAIRDANSLLNINTAGENQLRLFLARLGYDYGVADELAQCIMDWRDTDNLRRARGAEREAYVAAERVVLPRDGAFQDVADLRFVMHMTPEIYDSISPFLTVRTVSFGSFVNVNSAPEAVLASVPGMTDGAVAAVMRVRSTGRKITSVTELRTLAGTLGPGFTQQSVGFETNNLLVTSTGWNRGGRTPFRIEAVLSRPRGGSVANIASRRSW